MSTEPPAAKPARRSPLPRLLRVLAAGGLLAGSFAASTYLRPASEKAEKPPIEEAHAEEPDPLDRQIDRFIHNEQFAEALALAQPGEHPPAEPWLRYRVAVCLENLEHWKDAAELYESVSRKAPTDLWTNATLGLARCRLAHGDLADAAAAVEEVERLGGAVPTNAGHERTRLRACVEYSRLGPPPAPDPFDPKALAWPTVMDRRPDQAIWLPPAPPPDSHEHSEPHKHEEPISTPPPAVSPAEPPRDRVRQSLEKVLDHDDHPAVKLTLANLDAQDGAWWKAKEVYRELMDDEPDAPEAKLAAYNLGLALLKDGHTAEAREAFLGVLDRDPHGRWAELANYWIGRTYLDGGDPTAAIRPFRAAAASKAKSIRAAADLALVACQFLREKEESAEREIFDLRSEASASTAAMNDLFRHLIRHRVTPSELRAEQVAESLRQSHELRELGPAGVYLAGQFFREISDSSRMAELYDGVAADYRGPWAVRMALAAADHWNSRGRRKDARTRYLTVAAVDPTGLGRHAEQKLAALDLEDGDAKASLQRSLRLWKQGPPDREAALRLMGRGFEMTGHYAQAAECYAGRAPTLD